ncbi:MAG: THUMP domain-containing protein [Bacteroidota bacterium]
MFEYQKSSSYFAQVPGRMEELCEAELKELGAANTKISYRGVYFDASIEDLYKINYTSRMLSRVLAPLKTERCEDAKHLIKIAQKIRWEELISLNNTFAITSSVAKSKITNSLYAAQCLKDGIADYFRERFGRRPDVSVSNPDVRINLHIEDNTAVISLDTSGESLHKRGYRLLAGDAPMQETLAAAIIRLSGWNGENPLWDCMCGSGTIICEALMHYCNIPAQYLRKKFGFMNLPEFNKDIWMEIKEKLDKKIRPLPAGIIRGSDKFQKVLDAAKDNLSRLPFSESVELKCHPFDHVSSFENGLLITNPPYGIRLGERDEVEELYKELGDFIKRNCTGTKAFIYTGEPSLRKSIGLKTSRRIPLVNGKLEGVLLQIDSYEGSKKGKYLGRRQKAGQ